MPMTAAARAKARATRAKNEAQKPFYILANALKVKPDTLRAKLAYHGQRTAGVPLADLVKTLQTKTQVRFTPAILRRLEPHLPAPRVQTNPTAAPQSNDGHRPNNLKLAIMALTQVEGMICPLQAGHYGDRELLELRALTILRRLDKKT